MMSFNLTLLIATKLLLEKAWDCAELYYTDEGIRDEIWPVKLMDSYPYVNIVKMPTRYSLIEVLVSKYEGILQGTKEEDQKVRSDK